MVKEGLAGRSRRLVSAWGFYRTFKSFHMVQFLFFLVHPSLPVSCSLGSKAWYMNTLLPTKRGPGAVDDVPSKQRCLPARGLAVEVGTCFLVASEQEYRFTSISLS